MPQNAIDRRTKLILGIDDEEEQALNDAVSMVSDATFQEEDDLVEAVHTFAKCGFDAEEICTLLEPVATFSDKVCEPIGVLSEGVSQQIHIFGMKPEHVERDLLNPVRRAVRDYPMTALEVFEALRYCGPVVAQIDSPGITLRRTLHRLGSRALDGKMNGGTAGRGVRENIIAEVKDE